MLICRAALAEPVKQLSHRDRLYDATAFGGDLFVVGHPGLVLRSRDGGKSFENVRAGQVDEALFSIAFNRKGQGAIVGRSGFVLTTPDGGKSWHKASVVLGQEKPSLFSVAVLPDGAIVAVGEFGAIVRSEDQGKTWSRSSYTIKVETITGQAPVTSACLAAGTAETDNDDVVQEARLTDVAFADDKLGFAVAEFGLVLRSDDGGRTFKRQNSCTGKMLYGIAVLGPTHAIAVGADGAAVESNDAGITWALRETGVPEHLFGVFGNGTRLLVLGAAGVALVREGEAPFKVAHTSVHGWLTSAWFDDAGKGVVVGGRGYLRTTQDGGKTQQRVFGE
jgi:photosystem II stability/assembly factor-like uncharacterized protein